ncbi:phage tail tube protein [Curtobacterium sp. 22159]|uniref:phage tail tube protein n=1 Tax=Curtobacterium sp. 22159 TaxID=3453882 RepID=UPI003F835C2D
MSTALARKFACEVTADLTLSSGWLRFKGVNDFNPNVNPNLEDSSDYDTDGWASSEVTMQDWSADVGFFRRKNSGVYDAAQELVRSRIGKFDDEARLGFRWFDKTGGPEANQGIAIPTWKRSNTGVKNLEQATATFTGTDIPLQMDIENPYQATAAPVIVSATPGGQAAGEAVAINGAGFTGASGVKFGATSAASFEIVNDQLVIAVLPAGSAGSAPVTVTTGVGTSNAFAYTRGA